MMKILAITCCCIVSISSSGQNRDNIWELARQFFAPDCGVDFSNGVPDTFSISRDLNFFLVDASICDTQGQILFYTDGQWIANRDDDTLMNSDHFNPGWATDTFYSSGGGLGFIQGAVAFPDPSISNRYYLFYITAERWYNSQLNWWDNQPFHLSYSIIDMSLDNGLGGIVSGFKNLYAVEDTLVVGRLAACKHGNGRDWWVLTHEYYSKRFYNFLISPQGVSDSMPQMIGDTTFPFWMDDGGNLTDDDIFSQAAFSPDGMHYSYVTTNESVYLFDFDRCTGELSNFRKDSIPTLDQSLYATLGCSFSPNSRFLYVNTYHRIFQYDLEAADFAASRIQVGLMDSFGFPYIGWFFVNQLAPDNKIYLGTANSVDALHVIDQPDSLGIACNVLLHGLTLPTYNISVPNFPNYDLGALAGSPCDTLSIPDATTEILNNNFRIYPNPASWWVNIVYDLPQDALFELFDLYGRRVAAVSLYHYFRNRTLDVHGLREGVYAYTIKDGNEVLKTGKIAVIK